MNDVRFVDVETRISEQDLRDVEQRFGFVFPPEVEKQYLKHNGGRPIPNLFPKHGDYFAIHQFFPIKYGPPGELFEDTYEDLVLRNEDFPRNLVPIAIDAGGDFYCYSSDPQKFGAIYCHILEYYDDPLRSIVYLANGLDEFLRGLVSDPNS